MLKNIFAWILKYFEKKIMMAVFEEVTISTNTIKE